MEALLPLLGLALLALVGWDVFVVVLHPATRARGLFSPVVAKIVWRLVRGLSSIVGGHRLLTFAGPLAVATNLLAFLGGLWLGFALIYTPFMEHFSYQEGVPFGAKGFLDALYVSGTAATTVGFGDVVAETYPLRLATILEAGAGLAILTAALSFVLSVYPALTTLRSDARRFSDFGLGDPAVAIRLVIGSEAQAMVSALQQTLVADQQHLRRFPVRFHFPAADPRDSIAAVFRSALLVCLAGRAVHDAERAPLARSALEVTLLASMDLYERLFIGQVPPCSDIDERDVRTWFAQLRSHAGQAASADGVLPDGFVFFLRRGEAFLRKLDEAYRYEHESLSRAGAP